MYYADLASTKATEMGYKTGLAVALLTSGDVQGRLLGDLFTMQRNSEEAIGLLKEVNDHKNLSLAYYKLAVAYFAQGLEKEALAAAAEAKRIALENNNLSGLGWAIKATGLIDCHNGDYWKSFENLIESQQIGRDINDSLLVSTSLAFIGRSFNHVGDPAMALHYYRQSMQFATPFLLLWPHLEDIAYAHLQLQQFDSVLYYQQQHRLNLSAIAVEPAVRKKFAVFDWGSSVEVQLARKEYNVVLAALLPQIPQLQKTNDVIPLMQSMLIVAKCYEAKKEFNPALFYGRALQVLSSRLGNQQFLGDADNLLSSVFNKSRQPDSAFFYFRKYVTIRDSLKASQFAQRTDLYLAASTSTSKINALRKDSTIADQRLALSKKELLKQNQLKNLLVASLLALSLMLVLLARNSVLKRKNEKLQHEQLQLGLKRKALELEMQALRAQMNPHFIFNCLSAIDNLIQTRQPDEATSYLARFANLIRGVLDSSKNNLVSFQKDFETLQLYLEMEQFRCNNKFIYSLDADQQLLDGDYQVPPLIIQPFVENAIHHGLLNKPGVNRRLQVSAKLIDPYIVYSVTDNGVGRKRSALLKERNRPDHQSYGIAITRERIQLHNRHGVAGDVQIMDLEDGGNATGTIATVKIDSLES